MKIGIIGAGVMGVDTAISCIAAGHSVILVDRDESIIQNVEKNLLRNLRPYKMVLPSLRDLDNDKLCQQIQYTTDLKDLADTHWIIENASEEWETKKQIYQNLSTICSASTYIGVNTSCISITKIGALLKHPENIIGMHFMNPVPIKTCVELIKGFHTAENTINAANELLSTLNKKGVLVEDLPGFVSNRLSHLFMNEAAFLVQDGVASAANIDKIFKDGYGHTMGPLETADLIGLDTVVNSLKVLYESYQDSKFRCCPLLQKMVDAGLLGRKSGQGFYQY
ncbi:3-hydroxyacyl-CoA dehydrogenase family protein [Aliikangiella maris]|uniref:3-hydroxyacyl-CoA dehydrogenase NAD-binding domain-containing protein n=2 Tax=Aliikangiella maris TaxID=3162458 RepID=A0ABV3MKY0_9GAMM